MSDTHLVVVMMSVEPDPSGSAIPGDEADARPALRLVDEAFASMAIAAE